MDSNSQYELYLIKRELQSIINELDDIAYGIRRNFSNIGEDQAASCVLTILTQIKSPMNMRLLTAAEVVPAVEAAADHFNLCKEETSYGN